MRRRSRFSPPLTLRRMPKITKESKPKCELGLPYAVPAKREKADKLADAAEDRDKEIVILESSSSGGSNDSGSVWEAGSGDILDGDSAPPEAENVADDDNISVAETARAVETAPAAEAPPAPPAPVMVTDVVEATPPTASSFFEPPLLKLSLKFKKGTAKASVAPVPNAAEIAAAKAPPSPPAPVMVDDVVEMAAVPSAASESAEPVAFGGTWHVIEPAPNAVIACTAIEGAALQQQDDGGGLAALRVQCAALMVKRDARCLAMSAAVVAVEEGTGAMSEVEALGRQICALNKLIAHLCAAGGASAS